MSDKQDDRPWFQRISSLLFASCSFCKCHGQMDVIEYCRDNETLFLCHACARERGVNKGGGGTVFREEVIPKRGHGDGKIEFRRWL
jgi:hypothetical protein